MTISESHAAHSLAALGHEARIRVFKLLVRAGDEGLNVGEIVGQIEMPASTLAHHLSALVQVGLVKQLRSGREVTNRVDFRAMSALLDYLMEECCAGAGQAGPTGKSS